MAKAKNADTAVDTAVNTAVDNAMNIATAPEVVVAEAAPVTSEVTEPAPDPIRRTKPTIVFSDDPHAPEPLTVGQGAPSPEPVAPEPKPEIVIEQSEPYLSPATLLEMQVGRDVIMFGRGRRP